MLSKAANRSRALYAVSLGLLLLWLLALLGAPWLMERGYELTAATLYRGFALVCHQRGARSFHWEGWPLAVCARCTGIYTGALLGLLLYPCWQRLNAPVLPARRYLVLALAPTLIDWVLEATGTLASHASLRMTTGLIAGGGAAFYLLPAWLAVGGSRVSFLRPSQ